MGSILNELLDQIAIRGMQLGSISFKTLFRMVEASQKRSIESFNNPALFL